MRPMIRAGAVGLVEQCPFNSKPQILAIFINFFQTFAAIRKLLKMQGIRRV
jgi:hypothetical protein